MMHPMVVIRIIYTSNGNPISKARPEYQDLVYLMSDSVTGALPEQKEKTGQYNIGEMLTNIIKNGGEVKLCTSCAESRGVSSFVPGAVLGTLSDLTKWIVESDKALTF